TTRVPRLTRTPSKRACCSVFAGLSLRVLSTSTMAEGMEVEAAPAIRDKKRFEVKKWNAVALWAWGESGCWGIVVCKQFRLCSVSPDLTL
ncbi:RING-box protein 1A, partial [Geodia barretti]